MIHCRFFFSFKIQLLDRCLSDNMLPELFRSFLCYSISIFNIETPPSQLIFHAFVLHLFSRVTNYGGMKKKPTFFLPKKDSRLLSISLFSFRSEEPATERRSLPNSQWRRSMTRIIASRYQPINRFSRRMQMKSSIRMELCRATMQTTANSLRHNPMTWIRD